MKRMLAVLAVCAVFCAAATCGFFALSSEETQTPVLTEELSGTVVAAVPSKFVLQMADAESTLRAVSCKGAAAAPAVGAVLTATVQITPSGTETLLSYAVTQENAAVDAAVAEKAQSLLDGR